MDAGEPAGDDCRATTVFPRSTVLGDTELGLLKGSEGVGMTEEMVDDAGPSQRAHHAGGDEPVARRRISAKRRRGAVRRLLQGEPIELSSRELGVTAAGSSTWRGAFLAGGEASLRTRRADDRDVEIKRLEGKVGALTMNNELLEAKIDRLPTPRSALRGDPGWTAAAPWPCGGRGPPHAAGCVGTREAVSAVVSPSGNRAYGRARVCTAWRVSRATLYRRRPEAALERLATCRSAWNRHPVSGVQKGPLCRVARG